MADISGLVWVAGLTALFGFLVLAAAVALIVVALVQIARSESLDSSSRPMWALVVLTAPLIGAIIWFTSNPDRRASVQPGTGRHRRRPFGTSGLNGPQQDRRPVA